MKRRLFAIIFILVMMMCAVPLSVSAASVKKSGTWGTCEWTLDSNNVLTIGGGTAEEYENIEDTVGTTKIQKIVFTDKVILPESGYGYPFYELQYLTSIEGISYLDTSRLDSTSGMFQGCSLLKSLDLSCFNTSNVTNMSEMFWDCESLQNLDLANFNTSEVTDMYGMFCGCSSLKSIDVSSFDTSNVDDMASMFESCDSLSKIDLSSFDTSWVMDMNSMFSCSDSLVTVNLSSFDTSNVTNMSYMFFGCDSLENLDISNFDNSKCVTGKQNIALDELYKLKSLKVGAKFKFSNAGYPSEDYGITVKDPYYGDYYTDYVKSYWINVQNPSKKILSKNLPDNKAATYVRSDYYDDYLEQNSDHTRIAGSTRYDTALKVADAVKSAKGVKKFDNIIVATGETYPDALTGGYLAKVKNAPIILVNSKTEQSIIDYITSNIKTGGTVYILGGTNSVSKNFENKVKNEGISAKRIGGASRYATNLAILEEAGVSTDTLLVCSGTGFADSLSASATGLPILLVGGSGLTNEQKAFIANNNPEKAYIIGGTSSLNSKAELEISSEISNVSRLAGASRMETSYKIAKEFFTGSGKTVIFAYANNFPDGLAGGVLAMEMNAPLILANSKNESQSVQYARAYTKAEGTSKSITLGGKSLISASTRNKMVGL